MSGNELTVVVGALVALGGLVVLGALAIASLHARQRAERATAEQQIVALTQLQAETAARIGEMRALLVDGQAALNRAVNERLDSVSHNLNQSLTDTRQHTMDNLQKLYERLALIDGAQKTISDLASQVTTLQNVLGNKQQRGAFGQSQMEAIIKDRLPKDCYAFQITLSNRARPDCCIYLPDAPPLVIDAKFPLESVTAYRDAKSDEEKKLAAARVRQDVTKHIADIAEKYLIPGETHDMALMFVPSESVYCELYDAFDDIFQKAYRAKVTIVSPSLLMLAVQVIQQIRKDARMRAAADKILAEVTLLVEDVQRLKDRVDNLDRHFGQAGKDIEQIVTSAEKILSRGEKIQAVEFHNDGESTVESIAPPARSLQAGE